MSKIRIRRLEEREHRYHLREGKTAGLPRLVARERCAAEREADDIQQL